MKFIDADYYGYRDEDDGVIVPLEAEVEAKVIEEKVQDWKAGMSKDKPTNNEEDEDIYSATSSSSVAVQPEEDGESYQFREVETQEGSRPFVAHVPVPSQNDIEAALLRKKKMELLERYASESLQAQSEQAKVLMGL